MWHNISLWAYKYQELGELSKVALTGPYVQQRSNVNFMKLFALSV
jgi:hypothetical protein